MQPWGSKYASVTAVKSDNACLLSIYLLSYRCVLFVFWWIKHNCKKKPMDLLRCVVQYLVGGAFADCCLCPSAWNINPLTIFTTHDNTICIIWVPNDSHIVRISTSPLLKHRCVVWGPFLWLVVPLPPSFLFFSGIQPNGISIFD